MVGVGDTRAGVVGRVGRLAAAGIAMDEGALEICSAEAEVSPGTSGADEAVTEASMMEAGAEMLSEAAA